jgi:hypothetical protein
MLIMKWLLRKQQRDKDTKDTKDTKDNDKDRDKNVEDRKLVPVPCVFSVFRVLVLFLGITNDLLALPRN